MAGIIGTACASAARCWRSRRRCSWPWPCPTTCSRTAARCSACSPWRPCWPPSTAPAATPPPAWACSSAPFRAWRATSGCCSSRASRCGRWAASPSPTLGYFALLAPLLRYAAGRRTARARAPAVAIARTAAPSPWWTLYEFLKSSGYLGYPWGLIAYPVHAITPLVQFVDITGVWGLCLLMALVNAVAAEWLDLLLLAAPAAACRRACGRPPRRWRSWSAAALGYGAVALAAPAAAHRRARRGAGPAQRQPVAERRRRRHVLATLQRLTAEGIAASRGPRPGGVERDRGALAGGRRAAAAARAARSCRAALTALPVPLLTGVPWVVTEPARRP